MNTAKPITYAGFKITPTKIKSKGEIEDYFRVQSIENKNKGLDFGTGDALEKTLEEAKNQAESQRKSLIEDENREKENTHSEKIEKAIEDNENEYFGFDEKWTPLQWGKIKSALEKQVSWGGNIGTRKENIEILVKKGYKLGKFNNEDILENKEGNSHYSQKVVTKAGLQYAEYLVNNISKLRNELRIVKVKGDLSPLEKKHIIALLKAGITNAKIKHKEYKISAITDSRFKVERWQTELSYIRSDRKTTKDTIEIETNRAPESVLEAAMVDTSYQLNKEFLNELVKGLNKGEQYTRRSVEGLAKRKYSITNRTIVKEVSELAILLQAKKIISKKNQPWKTFYELLAAYKKQINVSFRTSQSTMLQQYSTPVPIAYLAGMFAGLHELDKSKGKLGFEPSAGNGLLTAAGKAENIVVNETDSIRRAHLQNQNYFETLGVNAIEDFRNHPETNFFNNKEFAAVITNPPFGKLKEEKNISGIKIAHLDHWMSINALYQMADNGKAAIIIGGHTKWDDSNLIKRGKDRFFLGYLYRHYNVVDVINISGDLYSRQGTSFNVRLILINGRKVPSTDEFPPLYDPAKDKTVKDYIELFDRISPHLDQELFQEDTGFTEEKQNKIKFKHLSNWADKYLSGNPNYKTVLKHLQQKNWDALKKNIDQNIIPKFIVAQIVNMAATQKYLDELSYDIAKAKLDISSYDTNQFAIAAKFGKKMELLVAPINGNIEKATALLPTVSNYHIQRAEGDMVFADYGIYPYPQNFNGKGIYNNKFLPKDRKAIAQVKAKARLRLLKLKQK